MTDKSEESISENSSITVTEADQSAETTEKVAHSKDVEKQPEPTNKATMSVARLVLVFVGLQVALFLVALDATIVATALPTIGSEFNEFSIVSWVATAYLLPFDAFQPLYSKFSDIFGRKCVLIFGVSLFLVGSLLCAVAISMNMLIAARVIAGIGAAGIISVVFIIISDLVPLNKRGKYQGITDSVFALASVFGPLVGGCFTEYVTWRWNFYLNIPIGTVALGFLVFFLDLPTPKGKFVEKLKRIDYAGNAIVVAFSTLFLLAMNFGGQMFPWKSAAVIAPLVLAVLLVGLLVLVEMKFAKEPLIPPRLLMIRSVACILTVNWLFGMAFFSMPYYLPIYFQVVRGDSALWSGIRLIPMQVLVCVSSTISGFLISRFNFFRAFIWMGTALLTLSVGLISLSDLNTSWAEIYVFTCIGGVGMGMIFPATIIGLQASVEQRDTAVVTGLDSFSRDLGGALGIAISSAILNSSLAEDLPRVVPAEYVEPLISSTSFVRDGLPPQYLQVVEDIYVDALRLNWYVLTPLIGIAFFVSLFVEHQSLTQQRETPNNEATLGDTKEGFTSNPEVSKEKMQDTADDETIIESMSISTCDDTSQSHEHLKIYRHKL